MRLRWPSKRRLYIAAVAVVGLLLTAEATCRIIGLGDPPLYQFDDRIGFMLQPSQSVRRFGNRYQVNDLGMRSGPCEAGHQRVLVLGDSIVNGGVMIDQADTATALASAGDPGGREWAQAAVGGWGTPNEWAWLREYGDRVAPVRVVLVISAHDMTETLVPALLGSTTHPTRKPLFALADLVGTYGGRYLPRTDPTMKDRVCCEAALAGIVAWCKARRLPLAVVVHQGRDEDGASPGIRDVMSRCRQLGIEPVTDFSERDSKAGMYSDNLHLSRSGQRHMAAVLLALRQDSF